MHDLERLGAFYLGRRHDLEAGETLPEPILYDAKDLTTHGVIVGMTGSGKTGLAVGLIEEALIDGIPVIAIDPKGDLGNLLLTFPKLRAEDFRPWVDEDEAARAGHTPDEHARSLAETWRKGIAEWDQGPERIERLEAAAERTLYTPGSRSGVPLAAVRSLDPPSAALAADDEALRERILASVSGLLGLLGIDADPLQSREHILLSTIVERAWRAGRGLDIPELIRQIQDPPVKRVGVLDLDSFFPAADRFKLAMSLNNLIASPGFSAWTEGEPLDAARLLHTEDGRPRLSVISIAHLSDRERMFVVTLVLSELLAWMRTQPGSRSLRALLYMDEVFGYFPPTANPPSKQPMLTLLKQARAFGVGCLLATQNPVDLDYKGLSNTGTWFLGRLQTERDKARVIEGLEGAAASAGSGFDRGRMEQTLAALGGRVFLMNNVHEDAPVVFHTRWALSYLAGPLSREQIRRLTGSASAKPAPSLRAPSPQAARTAPPAAEANASERPVVPPGIEEAFLPVTEQPGPGERVRYSPVLAAEAVVHYAKANVVDEWQTVAVRTELPESAARSPWGEATELGRALPELQDTPLEGAAFAPLPGFACRQKSYPRWQKMLATHLYRERPLRLARSRKPKLTSTPGEPEGEFRARLAAMLREERDLGVEKLRKRYAPKLARLEERIRTAEQRVEVEREQYGDRKLQTAISVGATVLGALFGRKLGSASSVGRATTAARSASRAARERGDISRAEEKTEQLRDQLEELTAKLEGELDDLRGQPAAEALSIEELLVRARKSDTAIERLLLLWTPTLTPT